MAQGFLTKYALTRSPNRLFRVHHPCYKDIRGASVKRVAFPDDILNCRVVAIRPFIIERLKSGAINRVSVWFGGKQMLFSRDPRGILKSKVLKDELGLAVLSNNGKSPTAVCLVAFNVLAGEREALVGKPLVELAAAGQALPLEWVLYEDFLSRVGEKRQAQLGTVFPETADVWEMWGIGNTRKLKYSGKQFLLGTGDSPFARACMAERILFRGEPGKRRLTLLSLDPAGRGGGMVLTERDQITVAADGSISSQTVCLPSGIDRVQLERLCWYFAPDLRVSPSPTFTARFRGLLLGLGAADDMSWLASPAIPILRAYYGGVRLRLGDRQWEHCFQPDGSVTDGAGKVICGALGPVNVQAQRSRGKTQAYFNLWRLMDGTHPQGLQGKTTSGWSLKKITAALGSLRRGEITELPDECFEHFAMVAVRKTRWNGEVRFKIEARDGGIEEIRFVNKVFAERGLVGQNVKVAIEKTTSGVALVFYYDGPDGEVKHIVTAPYDVEKGLLYSVVARGGRCYRRYSLIFTGRHFRFGDLDVYLHGSGHINPKQGTLALVDVLVDEQGNESIAALSNLRDKGSEPQALNKIRASDGQLTGYWGGAGRPRNVRNINGTTESHLWQIDGDQVRVYWWGRLLLVPLSFFGERGLSKGDKIIIRVEGGAPLAVAKPGDWELTEPHTFKAVLDENLRAVAVAARNVPSGTVRGLRALTGLHTHSPIIRPGFEEVAVGRLAVEVGEYRGGRESFVPRGVSLVMDGNANGGKGKILFSYDRPFFDGTMREVFRLVMLAERLGALEIALPHLEGATRRYEAGVAAQAIEQFLRETVEPLLPEEDLVTKEELFIGDPSAFLSADNPQGHVEGNVTAHHGIGVIKFSAMVSNRRRQLTYASPYFRGAGVIDDRLKVRLEDPDGMVFGFYSEDVFVGEGDVEETEYVLEETAYYDTDLGLFYTRNGNGGEENQRTYILRNEHSDFTFDGERYYLARSAHLSPEGSYLFVTVEVSPEGDKNILGVEINTFQPRGVQPTKMPVMIRPAHEIEALREVPEGAEPPG